MNATLEKLLHDTSRSFYRTLRVLPGRIRPQIGLAYLLARATDTIADTEIVPQQQRLDALHSLRGRILGEHHDPLDFGELAKHQGSPAERVLLERNEEALAVLENFNATDRKLIQEVLKVITSGQQLDVRRFGAASPDNIVALANASELDDYTYRVAGCVGEFWTKVCQQHEFSPMEVLGFTELTAPFFEELGVRFGKGLQLVNILRDLPADLRIGRCYLPLAELTAAGLAPKDLLDPANEPKLRPLYNRHLDVAESHLAAGWKYTNIIPWPHIRVRLACAWPILIGVGTIAKLRASNVLDAANRIKVSRGEVKKLIWKSVVYYPVQPVWKRLFTAPAGH